MVGGARRKAPPPSAVAASVTAALVLVVLAGCAGDRGGLADEPHASDEAPAPIDLAFLAPGATLNLTLDQPIYWVGPRLTESLVVPLSPGPRCEAMPEDPCIYYPIEVPEGTAELRAALDAPDHREGIYVALFDSAGDVRDSEGSEYTQELRVLDPEPGRWTLRVDPWFVDDAWFRMRVQAMSDQPRATNNATAVLPNMKPVPAFDFHFDMPTSQVGGSPTIPAGLAPTGCHPEEWAINGYEGGCLRFSFGWGNDGAGLFDALIGEAAPGSTTAPVTQRIHAPDGSYEDHPAGTATVHTTHGHYHLDDVYRVEAFRVEDGALVPAEVSAKRGSCNGDYVFMDWRAWDQEPAGSGGSNCGETIPLSGIRADPTDRRVAQTPGWGDIYFWELPDNYIVFDDQGDGEYIFRAEVDSGDVFQESNETDNVGYSHILVNGSSVQVLERGYGLDPWDPDKEVIAEPWAT